MEKELWLFIVKKNPCMRCSRPDTRPLKIAIHHNFFPLCCVQRWPRAWVKQYAGPHDLEGYLFCWIIQYIPLETLGGNLIWQEFAGGLKRPAVDKQSFNSWWSGPPRAEWSLLLKPLVQHRLSPCWLLMAEVLSDHLQTLLGFFCVVLSLILFLSVALFSFFHGTAENFRGDLRGIWSYPDFSLALCVEVWLTSSFVCFFPGTFPSPANSCLQGAHALCRAWWLRLEDELLCRPLFDRWSQLRLYTC